MTLHTVNKSPPGSNCLASCLRVADQSDAVLLIEDGVYAALQRPGEHLLSNASGIAVFALEEDIKARGISDHLIAWVEIVDYRGFVELTERHDKVVSWY